MAEIKIVNVSTGKETTREMNDKELAQFEADKQEVANRIKEEQEAKKAAQAKLEALGLTADDLRALLS